jgi:hypothetical protein
MCTIDTNIVHNRNATQDNMAAVDDEEYLESLEIKKYELGIFQIQKWAHLVSCILQATVQILKRNKFHNLGQTI